MIRSTVKVRRVGDTLVVTLTKAVVEETGMTVGDSLILETLNNSRILVRKESVVSTPLLRLELELKVLQKHLGELLAESRLAEYEANNNMPTKHPGIEDPAIMPLFEREMHWDLAKCEREIAEKELEIFEAGGSSE